jgi:hypothetical protein
MASGNGRPAGQVTMSSSWSSVVPAHRHEWNSDVPTLSRGDAPGSTFQPNLLTQTHPRPLLPPGCRLQLNGVSVGPVECHPEATVGRAQVSPPPGR